MIRALDTLVARLICVSLLGISLVHVLSIWSYEHALQSALLRADETRLAERIISIKRSVVAVPSNQREALAHELSSGPVDAHWSRTRATSPGGTSDGKWPHLAAHLQSLAPELRSEDVAIDTSDDAHTVLMSLRLPDQSWLNISVFKATRASAGGHGTLLSTSIMGIGVVLVSLIIARGLTKPLRTISQAVSTLAPDQPHHPIPEHGPREVRQLAAAYNDMGQRIAELIKRRTQALAAVSHDLRTPLTRLKLRLADIPNARLQEGFHGDLVEMEAMIDSTLSYLRGEDTSEPVRAIDLGSMLKTLVDDARDAGHTVALTLPDNLVVIIGRPVGLKRALSNVLTNATRFGTSITVAARSDAEHAQIDIADNGPGIPDHQHAAVFEPFVRLDTSRNRESGGVGLGLTIAKANIEADAGTITLSNRREGGLCVTMRLPRQRS